MYKNQLQELAQRSCFNLPSYACTREGPDHAPRFKASVNFNGEVFESPTYCTTLRQAEHSAAEVALNNLSTRGPSRSLTARVLDETGVYKNLLQETAHRAGLKLPVYTTVRSGPGHVPVFTCSVELAGMNFSGESAKTKKQAEKNAAIAAWSALKTMPNLVSFFESSRNATREEQDQNPARRRDHHQNQGGVGRRMVRGFNNNGGGSPINHLQLHHDQQRRLMDLLISEETGSSSGSGSGSGSGSIAPKKQNMNFVSLLPPPPPRTTSKILPPLLLSTTNKGPIPSLVQVIRQELQPPLDQDHQVEVEASKLATASRNVYGENSMYRRRYEKQTHNSMKSNHVGPDQMLLAAISSSINFSPPPSTCYRGFAPAVQIRSVIPVCAAAPSKSNPPPQLVNKVAQPIAIGPATSAEVLSESSSGQLTPKLKGNGN